MTMQMPIGDYYPYQNANPTSYYYNTWTNPPSTVVTRKVITTTREFDHRGKVVKEVVVEEITTSNVPKVTPYVVPSYPYITYDTNTNGVLPCSTDQTRESDDEQNL